MTHIELIGVMVAAGLLGGTINFALSRTEHSRCSDWFWSVVVGLGASLLVPLFLNTISSSLLSGLLSGTSGKADIYVFSGFCLLGAIASKAMIQTLSQRVLREAQEARKDVENLKEEIAPIVVKETEPEDVSRSGFKMEGYGYSGEEPELVIKSLGNSKYSRRTVGGIHKDTNVPLSKVTETLEWLEANGLAVSSGTEIRYWGLTTKGRQVFRNILEQG